MAPSSPFSMVIVVFKLTFKEKAKQQVTHLSCFYIRVVQHSLSVEWHKEDGFVFAFEVAHCRRPFKMGKLLSGRANELIPCADSCLHAVLGG